LKIHNLQFAIFTLQFDFLMPVRLDKWLWAARFFKTRTLAAESIDTGRVEVNGDRVKRSRAVTVGDMVRIRKPPFEQIVEVTGESEQRGSATVAATLYVETEESRKAREVLAAQMKALGPPVFRENGKPGKKERREIDRWRGRE
jgi:ribosome-associated heat shock protein Hsp15